MSDQIDDAEDFLAHFGVKGMKWGRHKAEGSSGPSRGERRRTRNAEINSARDRTEARVNNAVAKQHRDFDKETAKFKSTRDQAKNTRDRGLANAEDRADRKAVKTEYKTTVREARRTRDAGYERTAQILDRNIEKALAHPDVDTANKLSTGDKWALAALGTTLAGSLGVMAASAVVDSRS